MKHVAYYYRTKSGQRRQKRLGRLDRYSSTQAQTLLNKSLGMDKKTWERLFGISRGRGGRRPESKAVVDLRWLIPEAKPTRTPMRKPLRETEEGYYYRFPKNRYYMVRWLADGGYHLYPERDGKLPRSYPSRKAAEKSWSRSVSSGEMKVVSGRRASRYPVPKRW